MRGIGLFDSAAGVAQTFSDVESLAERCRFNDCAHHGEPGCAVTAAIDDGTLSMRRLESWLRLQREVRWAASRADARVRSALVKEAKRRQRDWKGGRP
jgi:ribosome biogenesis GTPase